MADTIHSRIKRAREARGIKQKQLAAILRVSNQTVSQWEKGRQRPAGDKMGPLAVALKVSVDYLYGREDLADQIAISSIIDVDMGSGSEIPLLSLDELMDLNSENIVGKKISGGRTVHTAHQWSQQVRAFTMVDASMEPRFCEDDIIVVDPAEKFKPGECVAAHIKSLGITVFRQFSFDGADHCILGAINPHFRSYRFTHQEWATDVAVIGPWVERTETNKRSPKRHTS